MVNLLTYLVKNKLIKFNWDELVNNKIVFLAMCKAKLNIHHLFESLIFYDKIKTKEDEEFYKRILFKYTYSNNKYNCPKDNNFSSNIKTLANHNHNIKKLKLTIRNLKKRIEIKHRKNNQLNNKLNKILNINKDLGTQIRNQNQKQITLQNEIKKTY